MLGVIYRGKLYMHPQAEQEVNFFEDIFLLGGEGLEGGNG